MTGQLYAQGDIILEPVDDDIEAEKRQGQAIDPDGAIVLGRGELSGHRHAVHGDAKLVRVPFSDIAREVPPNSIRRPSRCERRGRGADP